MKIQKICFSCVPFSDLNPIELVLVYMKWLIAAHETITLVDVESQLASKFIHLSAHEVLDVIGNTVQHIEKIALDTFIQNESDDSEDGCSWTEDRINPNIIKTESDLDLSDFQ